MKNIFSLLAFVALSQITSAQEPEPTKVNISLWQALHQPYNPALQIDLLVRGNSNAVKNFAESHNGVYKYVAGDISSIRIPMNSIAELSNQPFVIRVEGLMGKGSPMDGQSLINADVLPVHAGAVPLTQSYKGNGVITGLIDTGIDVQHPDFIDSATGNTRILFLWDQNTSGTPPSGFGYGNEWTSTQINLGTCTFSDGGGHGTNVAGTMAADNDTADYLGVAPQSKIICISILDDNNFLNHVADGVNYIFTKAAAASMPAVVNISYGTYSGSHDGKDLAALAIDNMIDAQNGRSVVAAAGNAGNIPFHLGYNIQTDSCFTWYLPYAPISGVYFEWFADTANFNNAQFAFGADNPASWTNYGMTQWYDVGMLNLAGGAVHTIHDTLWNGSTRIGPFTIYGQLVGGVYDLAVYIFPDSMNHYWRFWTKGSGYFDCYSAQNSNGTSNPLNGGLPTSAQVPEINRYRTSDYLQTLCSSFQCSPKVITVANYVNRNTYVDMLGVTQNLPDTVGARGVSSSIGPTRDGRVKPDISAPGNTTLCTGAFPYLAALIGSGQQFKVGPGGIHHRNGGTSIASPVVSGVVALFFEKYPSASNQLVRDAMYLSAKQDSFTTWNVPNIHWGIGKISAFAMLTDSVIYGCTDSTAFNYNPNANVDDSTCNYLGVNSLSNQALSISPNPFTLSSTIRFAGMNRSGKFILTDLSGKILFEKKIQNDISALKISGENLPEGILLWNFTGDSFSSAGKLLHLR